MYKLINATLSEELHKLYVENSEWLSDILSMDDQMHLFQRSFDELKLKSIVGGLFIRTAAVQKSINALFEKKKRLQSMLHSRIQKIDLLMAGNNVSICLEIVEEDKDIISDIKSLMADEFILKHQISSIIPSI